MSKYDGAYWLTLICFTVLQVQYMWLGSNFSILPISISSLGILLTLVTITVLVRNRDTPLVRASGETRL